MGHARIRGSRGWVTARGHPAPIRFVERLEAEGVSLPHFVSEELDNRSSALHTVHTVSLSGAGMATQLPHTSFRKRTQFSPMTCRMRRSDQPRRSITFVSSGKSWMPENFSGYRTSEISTSLRA